MKPAGEPDDHGRVVAHPGLRYLWAWILPAVAAAGALWLLWSNWKSQGPEIEIVFCDAPGIQAGKTPLLFRGVDAGTVVGVTLDPGMENVRVRVRLKAFAAGLARSGAAFWVERPELTLRGAFGIEALIQGNWIEARAGGGPPAFTFDGLAEEPLTPLEDPSLVLELATNDAPFLDRGSPVYFRGTRVGFVRQKSVGNDLRTAIQITIDAGSAGLVTAASSFWVLPAAGLEISGKGANLQIAGIDALLGGAIAFDHFGEGTAPAKDGDRFELHANETLARARGPLFKISLPEAEGLIPALTRITLLGETTGVVSGVRVEPDSGTVEVSARLFREYAGLLRSGTTFSLVRPRISLQGVSGLDALVGGPFLAMRPGPGGAASTFVGEIPGGPHPWNAAQAGLRVVMRSKDAGGLAWGSPVFFRGVQAGMIDEVTLGPEGRAEAAAVIDPAFAAAVRENSRFWLVSPMAASVGPGTVELQLAGLASLVGGAVSFDTFEEPGPAANVGAVFDLHAGRALAAATSTPFRILFSNGRGLVPGRSELRYLGLPVGVVESAFPRPGGAVEATARLRPGYEFLRAPGSRFVLIKPRISLQEFSGIETLVSGVYIDCVPGGGGGVRDSFTGSDSPVPEAVEADTFRIILVAKDSVVSPGAPILYRDYAIGTVLSKELSPDGKEIRIESGIEPRYRKLVRSTSKFRDASGTAARIGPFKIDLPNQSLIDPSGRIILTNPDTDPGREVRPGHVFPLESKR